MKIICRLNRFMTSTPKRFKKLKFPETYKYSSDSEHIPLEFYLNVFPVAKEIDLQLGYFSTNAFKVLCVSFAQFIANGGKMRIVTNHILNHLDKEHLLNELKDDEIDEDDFVINIFQDVSKLAQTINEYGKHFFDCLKYLKKNGRLIIVPVKFDRTELAHSKKMILFDGEDYISTEGSINFTLHALIKNSESFEVNVPWEGLIFQRRIENERANFQKIVEKEHKDYNYISADEIEVVINSIGRTKEEKELVDDSIKLDFSFLGEKAKKVIEKSRFHFDYEYSIINDLPHFPYKDGPRDYQVKAYENWVDNNYSGVFAMATGTGKTITSLNCVLQEFKKENKYNVIILVPSIALLNQWEQEVKMFNFRNILKIGGGNKWEKGLANFVSNISWGIHLDIVILSTYRSFESDKFQKYFQKIQDNFTLIADEAHNLGANQSKKRLQEISPLKRIGLSATPKRVYDPNGTDAINAFFNDSPPYTFSFSMERALNEERLTEYKYFPEIVELQEDELEKYIEISKKLLRYFDFEKGEFKNDPIVEKLLLIRKNLIHKAANKISSFKRIIEELNKDNKLKYVFTYVPEGYFYNLENEDGERIIHSFMKAAIEVKPDLKINSYTASDESLDEILHGFAEGKIEVVFAMKMLDEGVDVPRAEVGIFCSSTGNPRQFIQRRGRLLRKHDDKPFATIYDMVVVPKINQPISETFQMEKSQVKKELQRVAYFASLSMNYYDTKQKLDNICNKYDLSIDQIVEEL